MSVAIRGRRSRQFLAAHGWQATIVSPGEPEANYGRWPYPVASPTFAGLPVKIPRAYLVRARRMGGEGARIPAAPRSGPGDRQLRPSAKEN
jgi:hypothetical protein